MAFAVLRLVDENSILDQSRKNVVEVGGYLLGSRGSFIHQIEFDLTGRVELELASYQKMVGLSTLKIVAGYHTMKTDDRTELPQAYGYEWRQIGVGPDRLVPSSDGRSFVNGPGIPIYRFERIDHLFPLEAHTMEVRISLGNRRVLMPPAAAPLTCERLFSSK